MEEDAILHDKRIYLPELPETKCPYGNVPGRLRTCTFKGTGFRADELCCQGIGTSDAVTAVDVPYDGKGEEGCLHEGGRIYLPRDCRTLQHYHAGSFCKADSDEKKVSGTSINLE